MWDILRMDGMTYKNKTKQELIEELEMLKNEIKLLKGSSEIIKSDPAADELKTGPDGQFRSFAELAGGILDCIPANIALIDNSGKIIAVNGSWKRFARENGAPENDCYLGADYLHICEKTEDSHQSLAKSAAKGIRNVLNGQSPRFSLEYPCHSATEERWFRLFVTPFSFEAQKCAVVMHINITAQVNAETTISGSGLNNLPDYTNVTGTMNSALLDAIPDMILLINSEGVFLDSHIPEGNSSEFPLRHFIGRNVSEVLPQLVTEKTKLSFAGVLRDGNMSVMDFPLILDDIQFFYEARIVKCDEDKLLLLVRNITEKKKQEEEIRKLSLAIEQSPVIVLITDKKGKIEYVNPRFTEVTGFTFEEALGANPRIIKSDYTPVNQYKDLWDRLNKGEHWKGEFRNRKKNGELFWELASIFPIKNSFGEITQFVAVKEDITERKETELRLAEYRDHLEQLVEQRTESLRHVNQLLSVRIEKHKAAEAKIENQLQFLQTLIDTIPNPIIIKDKEGRLIDCNKAHEAYFGISLPEIKNKRVEDVVPPEFLGNTLEMEKKLLAAPGQMTMELYHSRKNGEPFALLVNEATYLETDNSIGGTVTLMIDISEQKKLQEKIQTALEKEQELNELKSSFISMASHEFRTPLTSILASADLLEMFGRQWKEEKYLEHIGKIQKGVDYMKELLDDVLVISRNEEGKTQFAPSKTNFLELCSELFDSARISSPGSHTFIFNYKPEQKLFVIDPKLIRHIVSNLLSNAVKYSPDGGKVILNVTAENNNILIDVIDEGIGIPEVDKGRLFEPFYRAGNTAAIHGTGLGMSIVKRSVELHNGQLSIDSEENRGTSVHVNIPFK